MPGSPDLQRVTRRAAVLLAVVLGLALGVVQTAGHAHRIAHAQGLEQHDCEQAHHHAAGLFSLSDAKHNCAAFDAATLGDGPAAVPKLVRGQMPAAVPAVSTLRVLARCSSWPGYLSRAPPRA